ncbi:MAG: PDZ domain-containing protein, partial [Candidatus Regiella insecticola]|nr:PDZ domain-containing protein [Candidatus Regiella insecticola]
HYNIIYKGLEGAELSNAEGNKGIKVGKVEANSIAARFGLKENDIITEVNTEKRPNLEKLRKILDAAPPALALGIQ